jgi:exodeoxyribonuclease V beta subunit
VPFQPVDSQGRKERLQVAGRMSGTEHLAPVDRPAAVRGGVSPATGGGLRQRDHRIAQRRASRRGGFVRDAEAFRGCGLRYRDPGRDGKEAQAVRAELAARGVRSVYLSDKDSVFAAQEAHDLLSWLKACAEPDVERLLKAALACITLELPLAELERLNQDELIWEARVMQFVVIANCGASRVCCRCCDACCTTSIYRRP